MNISFKNVKFTPMPAAVYNVKCIAAEQTTSSTGLPMIVWEFEIFNSAEFSKRRQKLWTVIFEDDSKNFGLKNVLRGLGYSEKELNSDTFNFEPTECIGKVGKVHIIPSTYMKKVTGEDGVTKEVSTPSNKIQKFVEVDGAVGNTPNTQSKARIS